jgi:hemerythrin-like metal-binding protein
MPQLKLDDEPRIHLPELDAEHRSISRLAAELKSSTAKHAPKAQINATLRELLAEVEDHFTHEERLMRAARYKMMAWHQGQHDGLRRRAAEFAARIQAGDATAGKEFYLYIKRWMRDHVAVADNMMGAAVRNHQRGHAA